MEPFERRFADRVHAYTEPATERRIDALLVSRTAMSSQHGPGWLQRRLGVGLPGRGITGARWAVAFVAVILFGVVGVAVLGRPSESDIGLQPTLSPAPSATGPVPEVLRHSWQRPYAVTPGLDQWGSGFLILTSDLMDFGPGPGDPVSKSTVAVAEPDVLVATATDETQGCARGDVGAYRWSLEGQDTVMTLTAISADACAARQEALAGQWVRSDLPPPGDGVALPPGTYETKAFDPFGEPELPRRLSYTVPAGWKVKLDDPATFLLHKLPDASSAQPSTDLFVSIFVQPRLAADFEDGAICGPVGAAPNIGTGIDDIVAAIVARPGVVSTPSTAVTIVGFEGQMFDVHLAPEWTGGCMAPEGPVVGMPILVQAASGSGLMSGLGRDHPLRLILLDLGGERTMAIVVFGPEPSQPSAFEKQVAEVMPIIESFEFRAPMP
jgi:hypothetical protein